MGSPTGHALLESQTSRTVGMKFRVPMHSSALSIISLCYSKSLESKGLSCSRLTQLVLIPTMPLPTQFEPRQVMLGFQFSLVKCAKNNPCIMRQSHLAALRSLSATMDGGHPSAPS
jgi:hypothetical protein